MQSLKAGTRLGGYVLLRLIARGGMGEVYEAMEVRLQRRVAIKVISSKAANSADYDNDELSRRFVQEARILAKVNHPNVVTIYSVDDAQGVPFIAMEFVEGASFKDLLKGEKSLEPETAAALFVQMAEGLRCLHENAIIHRDLKPHNILLRVDGQIKILDFGIAKHSGGSDHTTAGVVVGTLPYMAPEVKLGLGASVQSDIWSLGAIFFECLVGKRLAEVLQTSPEVREIIFPGDSARHIPQTLRDIICRMCAHRVKDRYSDASALLADLTQFQQLLPQSDGTSRKGLLARVEKLVEKSRQNVPSPTELPNAIEAPQLNTPNKAVRVSSTGSQSYTLAKSKPTPRARYWGMTLGALVVVITAVAVISRNMKSARPHQATLPPTATTVMPGGNSLTPSAAQPNLVEPSAGQQLWLSPQSLPTMKWAPTLDRGLYFIQIAKTKNFQTVLIQEDVSGTTFRPPQILPEGTYYWRLSPLQSSGSIVGPLSFQIVYTSPLQTISPVGDQSLPLPRGSSARSLDFSWNCKEGISSYILQIARESQFRNPLHTTESTSCTSNSPQLPPGEYYWRVGVNHPQHPIWSPTIRFKITPQPLAPTIAPPTALTAPRLKLQHQSMILEFRAGANSRGLASTLRTPSLQWQKNSSAKKYRVQIAKDRNFNSISAERHVVATKFQWESPTPGIWFWRVSSLGSQGEESDFSEVGTLNVKLPPPKLSPIYKVKANRRQLAWEGVPLASQYIVRKASRADLSDASESFTPFPTLFLQSDDPTTFISVAAADANGVRVSEFSSVASVQTATEKALLSAPDPLSPSSGAKAIARRGRISILFSWSQVERADQYTVEIAKDADFKMLTGRRVTRDRGVLFKQAQLQGRVYWRVRAESGRDLSEWSPPSYFDVHGTP